MSDEEPLKYGDLVCYTAWTGPHDGPIMYIGPCTHNPVDGLIDIIGIGGSIEVEHKAAAMWQRCQHGWWLAGTRDE